MPHLAAYLHNRLTLRPDHRRFEGAPVDITPLSSLELGTLWPLLQTVSRDDSHAACPLARSVLAQADVLALRPAFDLPAARAALALVAPVFPLKAVAILSALAVEPGPELGPELARIMDDEKEWHTKRYECYVMAKVAGPALLERLRQRIAKAHHDAPFLLREFALLDELSWNAALALASTRISYFWTADPEGVPDPAIALAMEPAYISFSQAVLTQAAQHAAAIHSGAHPFVADGAFALDDSAVLARAARVAAINDEPWLGDTMRTLLPKVSVAPTAAKTVPSQSLSIALGHAIEAVPTPETIEALREAIACVRHAGVAKKLERNLKPAERALALRPDLALRGATLAMTGKRERATLARCLEAGFVQAFELPWTQWQVQLAATTLGKPLARDLIWWLSTPGGRQAFMLDAKGRPAGIDGALLHVVQGCSVALWHPASSDASPQQWQALMTARQLSQPIRQAFRETYHAATPGVDFAGHALSLRPLIGLARREGWRTDRHALTRMFGTVKVSLSMAATLYPGADGWGETLGIIFESRAGTRWRRVEAGSLDATVFSEACRAVDLLVSVSTFAIAGDSSDAERGARLNHLSELPLSQMAAMRRKVLASVFAGAIESGALRFSERHVHVAGHAIHLATGRVSRDGRSVDIALEGEGGKIMALPWLPYDEALLEQLARTIGALLLRQV